MLKDETRETAAVDDWIETHQPVGDAQRMHELNLRERTRDAMNDFYRSWNDRYQHALVNSPLRGRYAR
jgi:hypothetical protein